jgi:hypothetical protein
VPRASASSDAEALELLPLVSGMLADRFQNAKVLWATLGGVFLLGFLLGRC